MVSCIVRLFKIIDDTVTSTESYDTFAGSLLIETTQLTGDSKFSSKHLALLKKKQKQLNENDKSTEKMTNLSKKTVPMIKDILKENNIQYKSTDRKKDLIDKIKEFLNQKK